MDVQNPLSYINMGEHIWPATSLQRICTDSQIFESIFRSDPAGILRWTARKRGDEDSPLLSAGLGVGTVIWRHDSYAC